MGLYAAVTTLSPVVILWVCFWAAAWVLVVATLGWMLFGQETIAVSGGDLQAGYHMLGWSKMRLYRGADIRRLSPAATPAVIAYRHSIQLPFLGAPRWGAVKFDYGARTVFLAPGLDEAEGRVIVERLMTQLPPTAAG